jgi:hypothetical protein
MIATISRFSKLIIGSFFLFALASCQKDINEFESTENADLTTTVKSSVTGFVTDENDQPVEGAQVSVGNINTTTDAYGYFSVSDADVVKNAALVTVKKNGYFPGIKTYIATSNKSAFFRIKLIPKLNAGTFSATAGGTISLSNGLTIQFPADAIINLASSSSSNYSGVVNVAASWINPTAYDINPTMPGDLRGLDQTGALKILQSFGMVAVELTSPTGDLLQIAPGKKAKLTFPIPNGIINDAPANIPLWYFDETIGLWKEEGNAVKSGSTYVGEVSHFSFWNCDVPSNYVQFNCTVVDADGAPVSFASVKISVVGSPYNAGWGITDSSGYVAGAIPNNASLLLEIFPNYNCGVAIYSQTFSTNTSNISLGTITIPVSVTNQASVSGTVTNCSGMPVTNGYVIMNKDNQFYRYNLNSLGAYNFTSLLCSNSGSVSFIGEDISTQQQSATINYTLVSGNNVVPNIQACGITTEQFFNYTINGTDYSFTSPADTFYAWANTQSIPTSISISASTISGNTRYGSISFDQTGIAVGSSQLMNMFYVSEIVDSTTFNAPININITEYGNVGEFVSGNYSGNMTGAAPANTPYVISGSFRVRRNF